MATKNYQELQAELDTILDELNLEDVDVDSAVKKYQRGLEIIKDLESHLKDAENTVKELKAKFSKGD